jgi:hypothetical protein
LKKYLLICPNKKELYYNTKMSDNEEDYQEKPTTYHTFCKSLESCKRNFFTKDYAAFKTELCATPCEFYTVNYRYSSDKDGAPAFVAKNMNSGFVKELDDLRKYFFCVFRCNKIPDTSNYEYVSQWIVNTPSLKEVFGERYEDFEWTKVEQEGVDEFLTKFQPLVGDDLPEVPTLVSENYVH